jgi:hypothetical protein
MKQLFILTLCLLLSNLCYTQTNFKYSYDAAGNRIKREVNAGAMSLAMAPVNDTIDMLLQEDTVTDTETDVLFEDNTGDAFPVILYPNPTYGQFTLSLPDFVREEKGSILVYDQMGKIIVNQKYASASQSFDISNVLLGYYIVHIVVNNKLVVKKIIKK